MAAERSERVYRFEPLDGSGVFLGLGLLQCALVGTGLVVAVAALTAELPLVVAAAPALVGVATAFVRVGGHVAWEWLVLGASWAWMRFGRGRSWFARLPLVAGDEGDTPLPPCLAGLSVVEVPWRGRLRLGAVRDGERHTLTAMVRVAGAPFVAESRGDQERLLAGWGDALNQFAVERTAVSHLSWSDFARRSGLREHRAWLDEQGAEGKPNAAADSYRELLAEATTTATAHDAVVSITVARDRLGRRAPVDGADAQLARVLGSSVEALLRALRSAGLDASDPLSAQEVQRLLRIRADPAAAEPRLVGGRLVERLGLVSGACAGPLALATSWRHVHVDGAFHRSWWVATWPRLPAPPSWLEPFLSGAGVTRTMTVVLCPVPAYSSRRRIERDLVKLESDAATKEQQGRRVDARHRGATQSLLDREEELVAGYAEMAYVGLVTVSASSEEELDEHGELIEQLARESGMELRPLDGRQDLAWAAALPFGLAPKTLLA